MCDQEQRAQLIESEVVMRQKREYIHDNPVKRAFVDLPEYWRWSSARDFADSGGLIAVDREWRQIAFDP